MLKTKYLHRRKSEKNQSKKWSRKKYKRVNKTDLFSNLPKHESIRQLNYSWGYCNINPLTEFLISKIGQNWNDIYSEILKKVKIDYRRDIAWYLDRIINDVIYDDEYIPRNCRGKILNDTLFVDMNNILTYKSKEQLILESKKIIRSQKLKEILENSEKNDEN